MFKLTKEDLNKIRKWKEENEPGKYSGAIDGRYTYEFTPTTLGIIVNSKRKIQK